MSGKQLNIYPFIKYKEWTFFPNPAVAENPEKRFQWIKDFHFRENDVLFCTPGKTGTHWVHEILSMLLGKTTEYNTQGLFKEMQLEYIRDMDEMNAKTGPRIFWTHLPFSYLPDEIKLKNGTKVVYINRNPKDRAVSFYTFLKGKIGVPDWKWSEFFDNIVLKDTLNSGWFNHTKDYHEAKKKKLADLFILHYEDLQMDTKKYIKELANFLKVSYTDDFLDQVVRKCSFDEMKTHKLDASSVFHPEGKKTLFRKGVIGDWKNWFTVAQNEQFDALYKQEMQDFDINFIYDWPSS